jgi:hypothetical protein
MRNALPGISMGHINFVSRGDKKEELKRLRFENGDAILDVESYFI